MIVKPASKSVTGLKVGSKNLSASVYDLKGEKIETVELSDKIFGAEVIPEIVTLALKVQKNGSRTVLGHTKTRSERRGGGRKPWKQKGTGRARHGSIRSPIWRKGGVTFGPRNNKNFSLKINAKQRTQAIIGTLSLRATSPDGVAIIDSFELEKIGTKNISELLLKLPKKRSSLLINDTLDKNLMLSARNIPNVKVQTADNLNVLDLLSFERVLISRKSLAVLEKNYLSN